MPPKSLPTLLPAAALGLVLVHACILLGGALGQVAVAFCAIALLIGSPIAILAWLGSASDRDARQRRERREQAKARYHAELWQRTLAELQPAAAVPAAASHSSSTANAVFPGKDVSAAARALSLASIARRRILGLVLIIGSALGLMGCETVETVVPYYWDAAPDWAGVQPGMGKTDLVALVGPPQQIKNNGTAEVWQYCRDNIRGRNARYYMAVFIDLERVVDVRPYPVWSNAGCQDFYRASF